MRGWSLPPAIQPGGSRPPLSRWRLSKAGIDALFIPEQADAMPAVASAFGRGNVKTRSLGTGRLEQTRVLNSRRCTLVLRP